MTRVSLLLVVALIVSMMAATLAMAAPKVLTEEEMDAVTAAGRCVFGVCSPPAPATACVFSSCTPTGGTVNVKLCVFSTCAQNSPGSPVTTPPPRIQPK